MAAFGLILGVLPAAAGCSADAGETAEGESVAPSPSSAGAEERALDAYEGLMGAIVEGSHEGATGHPDIAWYAKGQARELAEDMLNGTRATGEPDLAPEVTEVDLEDDPPTIVIEDCADGSEWLIVEEDLEGLEEPPQEEGLRLQTATVTEESGGWQVEKLWIGDTGGCDR
ncbi:hypothetical protein [Nocardiopsis composta]|uniref:Lipoprotein n=1 Tax=Nocardiopsis composta TaxID=157465 RepID=A0A7W8QRC0_9ACTN|nr:hypothetical protein [Nocardiopsis composta]MBB5435202.1 hypothetical protein [Nocardiopsis composta]